MFYTIYKTTNSITNEFYVGQHATSDLDDGYLGSGVDLLQSVKKYGKENFIKEILYIFDTEEEMNNKEIEIVDESFLSNPLVLNKQPGGWAISLDEYDPKRHKKVLGGIVAEVEGVLQYVTKEQFATNNLKGCHSNKVTVLDNNDKKRKHVTREEYYNNPNRYSHLSKGRVTVYDKIEKTYLQIPVEELLKQPERYLGTTSGQRTVWDIETKQFKNIPKQFFDRQYHRLASDKHILCYDPSGKILINFWGSKKDFVKIYGLELYNQALKETKNYQPKQRHRFSTYVGCSFKLIDWRN